MFGIIYCAENEITGMKYIGKTTKSLEDRAIKGHIAAALKNNYNNRFINAITYYKPENFKWYVIDSSAEDMEELNALEQHYICKFKTYQRDIGYNKTFGGDGTQLFGKDNGMYNNPLNGEKNGMYGKHHTKETKQKIREANLGNKNCLGRKLSEETKEKIRNSQIGKAKHTEEFKEEKRKFMSGRKDPRYGSPGASNPAARPIKVIDPDGNVYYYNCMKECTLVPYHQLKFLVAKKKENFKGYKCEYYVEEIK